MVLYYAAIEGILGVGKTSLLENISSSFVDNSLKIIREPLYTFFKKFNLLEESYKDRDNISIKFNPLEECYKDPEKNFPISQLFIIDKLVNTFSTENEDNIFPNLSENKYLIVSDRSIYSPEAFIKARLILKNISLFTSEYLLQHLSQTSQKCMKPDIIFYLDCPIYLACQRVRQMGRKEENFEGLEEFQQILSLAYSEFLLPSLEKKGVKVFKIKISENTSLKNIRNQMFEIMRKEFSNTTQD